MRTFLVAIFFFAVAGCGPSEEEIQAENKRRIGILISEAIQGHEKYDPSKLEETKKGEEWTYEWFAIQLGTMRCFKSVVRFDGKGFRIKTTRVF